MVQPSAIATTAAVLLEYWQHISSGDGIFLENLSLASVLVKTGTELSFLSGTILILEYGFPILRQALGHGVYTT